MPAQVVDPRIERRIAARRRIHRERPGRDRGGEYILSGKQPAKSQRSGYLRAIEQRQPLLGCELDRLRHAHLADAKQRQRQVREWREVAGGADRTLGGNARIEALVVELEQALDEKRTNTGIAARQALDLERERHA